MKQSTTPYLPSPSFRTEVPVEKLSFPINHYDKLVLMGSCFAEHMGEKLLESGFTVDQNPFGVLYNPLSIAQGLRHLLTNQSFTEEDLFVHQGVYSSFSHHSRFSALSASESLHKIRSQMAHSVPFLQEASVLLVTFGTAHVYSLPDTKQVVANCHKLPEPHFIRSLLRVEEIVDEWTGLLQQLQKLNPNLRLLFTVSPVRHWKDGAHANQISKATLLLALDRLCTAENSVLPCRYFPSYELVLDDLRDYRFYAEDMLHPSSVAVNYVWDKFTQMCFTEATLAETVAFQKLHRQLQHRPFYPHSEAHQQFIKQTEEQLQKLHNKYRK